MENTLQIRVIYFAKLRDLIGLDEEIFSMEEGDSPSDVLASINKKHEIDVGANFKIAVNDEFSQWDIKLNNGDRLVFIPPVTGG
ncbi:MAG TPA: MoaD/ThiS family protein [Gammaproteobacteria bacterium]|nr:MoaD/ThiS family protein [Gammaproteobacteria bacterium]